MAALLAAGSTTAGQDVPLTRILPDDGTDWAEFGGCVDVDGATAIIGAAYDGDNGMFSGSAYLFDVATGAQLAKLLPDDGASEDHFGVSVAIDGSIAIVGAWQDDENGDDSGAVYVFDTGTGAQLAKLLPGDGAAHDGFGWSVSLDGTIALVGAWTDDDNGADSGSAYLFDVTTGEQLAKLLPDDGEAGDQFGCSVALDHPIAIVGACMSDDHGSDSGSAYLFDAVTGSQLAKLLPDVGGDLDGFGWSVDIDGSTAIVGADFADGNDLHSGVAYLFDAGTGEQRLRLCPEDGAVNDLFGISVDIDGPLVIVGAAWNAGADIYSGSVYVYSAASGKLLLKLFPDDGEPNDWFGGAVALDGHNAIFGALWDDDNGEDAGSAYLADLLPLFGDLDGDGCVGQSDLGILLASYNLDDGGDIDGDGDTDQSDLGILLGNYGQGC